MTKRTIPRRFRIAILPTILTSAFSRRARSDMSRDDAISTRRRADWRRVRWTAWLAVIVTAAGSVLVGAAAPASAAGVDIVCAAGTTQITYTPGLRLLPQTVNVEELDLFTGCVSSDPTIHSGIASFSGPSRLSCAELLGSEANDYTVVWNNGQSSTFTITFTITTVGGLFIGILNGVVTSGQFTGDSARMVFTYLQPNIAQCLTPAGVTEATGTVTAEIGSI